MNKGLLAINKLKVHPKGKVIGAYTVLEYLGIVPGRGTRVQSQYKVRCNVCGNQAQKSADALYNSAKNNSKGCVRCINKVRKQEQANRKLKLQQELSGQVPIEEDENENEDLEKDKAPKRRVLTRYPELKGFPPDILKLAMSGPWGSR